MKRLEGRWQPHQSCAVNLKRELPRFIEAYFTAGRKAARKRASVEQLHEFRLATKHFRYLVEMFQPLLAPRVEELLKRLRHIQNLLGDLNDYATTRQLLESEQNRPEVVALFSYLDEASRKKRREFRRYWLEVFDAEDQQDFWLQTLTTRIRRKHTPAAVSETQPQVAVGV